MKIVVFDDCETDRIRLTNAIRTWAEKHSRKDLLLLEFSNMDSIYFSLPDIISSDFFFLDIMTDTQNYAGLVLAQKIHSSHPFTNIVFTTSSPDFWSDAFDISARHYLIKPVRMEKLFDLLDRLYIPPSKKVSKTVSFWGDNSKEVFDCDKILYIEAVTSRHTAIVQLTDQTHVTIHLSGMSFSDIALSHLPSNFVQCQKSFIINTNYIAKYNSQYVTLFSCEEDIPIGRKYRSDMLGKLVDRQKGEPQS